MFEDLKQQRLRGMSVKERTRLFLTVSLVLVVGGAIYGQRQCSSARESPTAPSGEPTVTARSLETTGRPIDPAPFEGLRGAGGTAPDVDNAALDHALREIRGGQVALATHAPKTPAEVLALDPKASVGTPIEVVGRVRQLAAETYDSSIGPVDRLWWFALEGEDGARVVVAHGGSTTSPEEGKPLDEQRVDGYPVHHLVEDDVALVRGVYLQKKTAGTVGTIRLGGPTPVIVGAQYRRLPGVRPLPAPASLAAIDWSRVRDRINKESAVLQVPQHFQVLAWARAKGHDAIVADLRSGALPSKPYDRDEFLRWNADVERDNRELDRGHGDDASDRREWTKAARGQVFVLTGKLWTFDEEGWATVEPNSLGVNERWMSWMVSDHHHSFGVLPLHSPFPLSEYKGIRGVRDERIKVYGVFVKNFSYVPSGRETPTIAPYFVMLHMESYVPVGRSSLWDNVFWYATLALLVLGVLFYVVLIRGERKESATMEARRIALRKRIRAHEGLPGAPTTGGSGSASETAGKGAGPPA
jgi:hypothetical protein